MANNSESFEIQGVVSGRSPGLGQQPGFQHADQTSATERPTSAPERPIIQVDDTRRGSSDNEGDDEHDDEHDDDIDDDDIAACVERLAEASKWQDKKIIQVADLDRALDKAVEEIASLRQELKQQKSIRDRQRLELAKYVDDQMNNQLNVTRLEAEIKALKALRQDDCTAKLTAETQVDTLGLTIKCLQTTARELREQLVEANSSKAVLETTLNEANTSKTMLQTALDQANASKTELQVALDEANSTKTVLQSTLNEAKSSKAVLEIALEEGKRIEQELQNQRDSAKEKAEALSAQLKAVEADRDASNANLEELEKTLEPILKQNKSLRDEKTKAGRGLNDDRPRQTPNLFSPSGKRSSDSLSYLEPPAKKKGRGNSSRSNSSINEAPRVHSLITIDDDENENEGQDVATGNASIFG